MHRILTLALAASLTPSALAGHLDRAWVDPESTWMVHVDFEALMGSQLFRGITDQAGVNLHQLEQHFRAEIHDELAGEADIPPNVLEAWHNADFSVLEDMKSITIFGTDAGDEPAAVILTTTDAIDQIVATLDPIEGINVALGDTMTFVALREPGAAPGDPREEHVAAIRKNPAGDRTIVIAESTAMLIDELNLFARQSAPGAGGPAWASARPGSVFLVHVSGDGLHHLNDEAGHILGQARQIHLEAGESAGEVYFEGVVEARDANTVTNIAAIATGLMAAGRLGLANQPEGPDLIRLLNGVRISTEGSAMSVGFRMPSDTLIETMKRLDGMHDKVEILRGYDADADEVEVEIKVERE